MHPSTIFGFLTAAGIISLGFGRDEFFSIAVLGITVISFLATFFFSVKTSTRSHILAKIAALPFPDWMTPLFWVSSAVVMGILTLLTGQALEHFDLVDEMTIEVISVLIVGGFAAVLIYWGIVGVFRYFKKD